MEQLRADLQEVKADLKELIRQGAVHNVLLKTHEARSLALQEAVKIQAKELEPVKRHVAFVNGLGKVALAVFIAVMGKLVLVALHLG
jgi:hypothetical protein